MAKLIGIDVGGTNLRLGVIDYTVGNPNQAPLLIEEMRFQADFSTLCKSHQHSPAQAWQLILTTIASAISKVREKHPEVSAVGVGFPGFIDPNTQKIAQSPNLPNLSQVDLTADLSRLIQLPVITENDALAAAYGEYVIGTTHTKNLIYLGLGTGVGGGLVMHGQPFPGQHGVAMEVGHIIVKPHGRLCGCGNHGCMEQYASASGVSLSYFEATSQHCSAEEVANRAYEGDQDAVAAYALAGATLAQALAHILKVIDVTDVLIGGGMSVAWPLMVQFFQQQLDSDLIPVLRGKINVNISRMGDQAGIIGAAMLAQQKGLV
ncbi:MAG: ROK family protein [Methylotenera sp.]|nr:ROK family protein [Methylotenera sp.]